MAIFSPDLIKEYGVAEDEPRPLNTNGYVIPEQEEKKKDEDDIRTMIQESAERQKRMQLEINIQGTQGVNPDEHAEAVEIGDKKKLPADAVRANIDEYREDARQKEIKERLGRWKERPVTFEVMSDPDKAKVVWDDIDIMQRIEGIFFDTKETGSAYWKRVLRDPFIATAGKAPVAFADALAGLVDMFGTTLQSYDKAHAPSFSMFAFTAMLPDEMKAGLPTVKKELKKGLGVDFPETQKTLHSWLTPETRQAMQDVEAATGMLDTIKEYFTNPAALSQDMLTSWPYLVSSMAAAKKAYVLGASEFNAMMVAHATEGILTAGAMNSALQDQGVDPDTARKYSSTAGFMTSVIGFVAGRLGFGDAVESALIPHLPAQVLRTQATRGAVKDRIKRLTIETVKGFVQEGVLEEGGQNVSEKFFENLATGKPATEGLGKAYGQGVAVGGPMGSTMNVMNNIYSNMVAIERAKNNQEMMEALGDDVKASKLRERSAPIWQNFIDAATRNGDVENVYITLDKMEEYFQENKVDMQTLAEEVPEISEWLNEARERNADVAIPIADYVNYIAPTEMHNGLILDTKFNPVDLTPREAMEMEKNLPDLIQEMVEMEQGKLEAQLDDRDAYDYIVKSMTEKMVRSGNSPTIAAQQAPILAAGYDAIAQTYGKDARNLYDQYNIETRYPIPKTLTTTASIDAFINDVRKGTADMKDSETLVDYLDSRGVDIATATNKQVKDAMRIGAIESVEDAAIQEYNQYDDYTVTVDVTEAETGKTVTIEQNAGEAIEDVDSQVEVLQELINCVRA